MLPKLNREHQISHVVKEFIVALQASRYTGEVDHSAGTCLVHAIDNSAYQVTPQVVLFPKHQDDLIAIFQLAKQPTFHEVHFTAKGGGVTTNGQCLSNGIIIDCSKYLNHIVQLNLQEGWVRVEPGVVLDQLQAFLKPHGYFFPITIAPSTRCTLGGMTNTNSCGQGSMFYGRMSDHILSIKSVFTNGHVFESSAVGVDELDKLKAQTNIVSEVYRQVDEVVTRYEKQIAEHCPDLPRTVTGYNLGQVVLDKDTGLSPGSRIKPGIAQSKNRVLDLNRIIAGSEGTLTVVSELKLRITKIPVCRQLVVIQYTNFQQGLEDALVLNAAKPESIETVDGVILALAKTDLVYPHVSQYVETPHKQCDGITLIQFVGEDEAIVNKQIKQLETLLQENPSSQRIVHHVVMDQQHIDYLWHLRKSSVGLLGKTQGRRKPMSGMEDTMVPPMRLAAYITAFRGLLDDAGLEYGMFGHVDAGCMHVRPKLDLSNPDDEALYHSLSDKAATLAKQYDGIMWGEHGKGMRCEYMPDIFGEDLFKALCKIKKAFDPYAQLNRGKIAVPSGDPKDLITSDMPSKRGHFDRQVSDELREEYDLAMSCNGNGACFNYDEYDQMCPSYKVTRDRRHSPKGRATLIREWVRLLSLSKSQKTSVKQQPKTESKDYSKDVYDAMAGCLGCKACATQCPVNVDVPSVKSRFLELYHTRYRRSWRDKVIANTEYSIAKQAKLPRVTNFVLNRRLTHWMLKKAFKLVDAPLLSTPTLHQLCCRYGIRQYNVDDIISAETKGQTNKAVVLIQDWVTRFYEADIVVAYYQFLTKLGFKVYLLKWFPNGKPLHVKGYLQKFGKFAQHNITILSKIQAVGVPMVGIDPSITLTYRDEYAEYGDIEVHLIQEWLAQQDLSPVQINSPNQTVTLLMHCTEKTHHVNTTRSWQTVFSCLGLKLNIAQTGCCGMAGTYGHELEHQVNSRRLFEMSWEKYLSQNGILLASGYSCRSQVQRLRGKKLLHPVVYLTNILHSL